MRRSPAFGWAMVRLEVCGMASKSKDGRDINWGIFDWVEWDPNAPSQIFDDRLSLLEYADKQDFYCYHVAEHHTTPLSVAPSPGQDMHLMTSCSKVTG